MKSEIFNLGPLMKFVNPQERTGADSGAELDSEHEEKDSELNITGVEVDPYSIELLKMGKAGQRYVTTKYLDKDGILYSHYTPSYVPGDSVSEQRIKEAKFLPQDVVAAIHTVRGMGLVHDAADKVVKKRYAKEMFSTHKYLLSEYMLGGASDNWQIFYGSSTHNDCLFEPEDFVSPAIQFKGKQDFYAEYLTFRTKII